MQWTRMQMPVSFRGYPGYMWTVGQNNLFGHCPKADEERNAETVFYAISHTFSHYPNLMNTSVHIISTHTAHQF